MAGFAAIVAGRRTGKLAKEIRAGLPPGYDPAHFDPGAVRFSDPARRLAYSWYGDPATEDAPFGE